MERQEITFKHLIGFLLDKCYPQEDIHLPVYDLTRIAVELFDEGYQPRLSQGDFEAFKEQLEKDIEDMKSSLPESEWLDLGKYPEFRPVTDSGDGYHTDWYSTEIRIRQCQFLSRYVLDSRISKGSKAYDVFYRNTLTAFLPPCSLVRKDMWLTKDSDGSLTLSENIPRKSSNYPGEWLLMESGWPVDANASDTYRLPSYLRSTIEDMGKMMPLDTRIPITVEISYDHSRYDKRPK